MALPQVEDILKARPNSVCLLVASENVVRLEPSDTFWQLLLCI